MTHSVAPDYSGRLDSVREAIANAEVDAFLIFGPANRRYLTGFTASDGAIGESSGAVLITPDRAALLVSPLYLDQARVESTVAEPVKIRLRSAKEVSKLLGEWAVKRLAFERDYTLYGYYADMLENMGEGSQLKPLKGIVEGLRVRKDSAEQEDMREAARIADEAFRMVASTLAPGVTERHVAHALDEAMVEFGADSRAFETIVAAGPNSARPHHEPGNRLLQNGDPVVIDMGARYNGYCSDMTRSFCVGEPDDTYRDLHALVLDAYTRGADSMREGVTGKDADAVVRTFLKEAGYEEEFCHSLGHGLGLDVHEAPHLYNESEDTLAAGMAITVEPGVYVSGWGGIRIEDTVILNDGGNIVLNHSPKDVVIG